MIHTILESNHSICDGCGREIDPDVCWCGDYIKDHDGIGQGHSPLPMGCVCHYYKEEQVLMDDEDLGGDAEMSPEDEQKMIDELVAEQLASIATDRDAKMTAAGVEPPQPKKTRGRKPKIAAPPAPPAPVIGASAETAERCLKAMQVLRDIGVSDTEFAKILNVSRATVNNLVHEKRGAKLAGSKEEFDAIYSTISTLRTRLTYTIVMMDGGNVGFESLWPDGCEEDTMGLPPEVHALLAETHDAKEQESLAKAVVAMDDCVPAKKKWVDDSDPHAAIAEVLEGSEEESLFADDDEEGFAEDDDTFGDESV
jgi:hypothetical protein